jgi:hypothetical protein
MGDVQCWPVVPFFSLQSHFLDDRRRRMTRASQTS